MLSERMLSTVVRACSNQYLKLTPTDDAKVAPPKPGQRYMLYMHVPFCERLCPYCSFNRFPFKEERAKPYFANMRKEMMMLKDLGYDFESVYIGGGTPTIMIDELCETIDMARENFSIKEVSSETNPNHLIPSYLEKLKGRVDRLSVGVQSFDDGLLKQMDRYEKYGCGQEIMERIQEASPYFVSMNADMIFNFPAQTEDILINDIERVIESGRMSIMGKTHFSKHDRMRYRFMMQLFGLRLDKKQFKEDFGCSIEAGLPAEMAFMTAAGAFATNNDEEITLTPKGRYLMVVMMRQFFIGVNNLRDQARAALPGEEKELLFGC